MILFNTIKERMICRKGSSGGGYDVNQVSSSTAAQWETWAKDWNKYLADYEPRIDFATEKYLLADPTNQIQGAANINVQRAITPESMITGTKGQSSKYLSTGGKLSTSLNQADIGAQETAKDYQASALGSALSALRGEKTATIQGLNPIIQAQNAVGNEQLKTNYLRETGMDTLRGQGVQSAIMGVGVPVVASIDRQAIAQEKAKRGY